jgi:hypothetical protein
MTQKNGSTRPNNPDCYFGDHSWRGGICSGCGERLRCYCGAFAYDSDAWWERHVKRCPVALGAEEMSYGELYSLYLGGSWA